MNWKLFKTRSEKLFETIKLNNCWGFQIQARTKWNNGLSLDQIDELEILFGFNFPVEYRKMISEINGFDRDEISIDPDKIKVDQYKRCCYKYPEDFASVQWLIDEITENINYVNETLIENGFNPNEVLGFLPLFHHRALVVFKDKTLTPVISIHQGTDIIICGKNLKKYWENELEIKSW
jgi:hypothetical protein